MSKLSNLILMIQLLNNKKKYSINELSQRLEISPRMVKIYKNELEKAGIYVDTIRGPYGGYVLNQSIIFPNIKISQNDIKMLEKTRDFIKDKKLRDDVNIFKEKLTSILEIKNNFEELKLKDELSNYYNKINRAIKEKRKVKILYYSYNKGENERIIHPYEMFLYQNGWSVAAYCESRKDIRNFEISRIIKLEILDIYFD